MVEFINHQDTVIAIIIRKDYRKGRDSICHAERVFASARSHDPVR
jgi:hypothetical protein